MDHNHIKGNFVNHFKSNAYGFQEVQARIHQANELFEIKKASAEEETKIVKSRDHCYKTF
jgi:hypothetical protein